MKITIKISRIIALLSVQYQLEYGEPITSRNKFRSAVTQYVSEYGYSSMDSHLSGLEHLKDKAEEIVNKYFK